MKDISIILPTRGNPSGVHRLLENIAQTASNPQGIEIILHIDEDDIESRDVSYPDISVVKLIKFRDTLGNVIRACFRASKNNYIMLLSDDAVFRTKKWDRAVCDVFSRFSDGIGMVYGNDLINEKKLASFPVLSRAACELMDSICPSEYVTSFVERHIFDIFMRLSRFGHKRAVYIPELIIEKIRPPETQILKSSTVDEMVFISSDEYRNYIARKLAKYIENDNSSTDN